MYLIDTNSLVILILGLLNVKHLGKHKRASIYDEDDFIELLDFIEDPKNLVVLPNVWSEVDNLLNDFAGAEKYPYIQQIIEIIQNSSEIYLDTQSSTVHYAFPNLGITDSLLLTLGKDYDALITSDSQLSDYALSMGIFVYDMVKLKNEKLQKY